MPITFSVTCDTDEELAQFLKTLRIEKSTRMSKSSAGSMSDDDEPMRKMSKAKKAAMKTAKMKKAPKPKMVTKTKPASKMKMAVKASTTMKKDMKPVKAPRREGQLRPIVEAAVNEVVSKKKPFKSGDVTDLVMKKYPRLNRGSVITGISNHLKQMDLDWKEVRDAVGRPYKLYSP